MRDHQKRRERSRGEIFLEQTLHDNGTFDGRLQLMTHEFRGKRVQKRFTSSGRDVKSKKKEHHARDTQDDDERESEERMFPYDDRDSNSCCFSLRKHDSSKQQPSRR